MTEKIALMCKNPQVTQLKMLIVMQCWENFGYKLESNKVFGLKPI